MKEPLEPIYIAACPFCDYREFFSSAVEMLAQYGSHLLDHSEEALEEQHVGGRRVTERAERIARHARQLAAARYN